MPVAKAIKKGVKKEGKEYLSKINLVLLVLILITLLGLFYYSFLWNNKVVQGCNNLPSGASNSVIETNNGKDLVVISNTTVIGGNDCYLTYVCENSSRECTPTSNQTTCLSYNQLCVSDSQCCTGLICQYGSCQPPAIRCIDISGLCTSSTECCAGLICNSGTCQPPLTPVTPACRNISAFCTNNTQCCSGLHCTGETCQP